MTKKAAEIKAARKDPAKKKAAPKKKSAKKGAPKKWSKKVTQTSNAMDLEKDVFKQKNPKAIAKSVKRSA